MLYVNNTRHETKTTRNRVLACAAVEVDLKPDEILEILVNHIVCCKAKAAWLYWHQPLSVARVVHLESSSSMGTEYWLFAVAVALCLGAVVCHTMDNSNPMFIFGPRVATSTTTEGRVETVEAQYYDGEQTQDVVEIGEGENHNESLPEATTVTQDADLTVCIAIVVEPSL